MASRSLDRLPAELQLMVFGFAYAGSNIAIDAHKNYNAEAAMARTSPNKLGNTLISKSTHTTAWQAYLRSATWSFASVATSNDFFKSATSLTVKRHIRHVRIDSPTTETVELLGLVRRAGCAPRTIELTHCTAYDSGAPQPALSAWNEMQRNETEVIQHLLRGSCHITDVTQLSQKDVAESPFVQALICIPTLEDVTIIARCGLCTDFDIECDWTLPARITEACVLRAVARSGVASRRRRRNIARIEAEIQTLKNSLLARDGLECIDIHCRLDYETDLEADDKLEKLVG
ncbi:hypothetical protein Slin14017_G110160 [Septoria linicola]|nr:hypothetical protein Slin14017_G110160 [Septoria linicola]